MPKFDAINLATSFSVGATGLGIQVKETKKLSSWASFLNFLKSCSQQGIVLEELADELAAVYSERYPKNFRKGEFNPTVARVNIPVHEQQENVNINDAAPRI